MIGPEERQVGGLPMQFPFPIMASLLGSADVLSGGLAPTFSFGERWAARSAGGGVSSIQETVAERSYQSKQMRRGQALWNSAKFAADGLDWKVE